LSGHSLNSTGSYSSRGADDLVDPSLNPSKKDKKKKKKKKKSMKHGLGDANLESSSARHKLKKSGSNKSLNSNHSTSRSGRDPPALEELKPEFRDRSGSHKKLDPDASESHEEFVEDDIID
jgi:hypothetical protein